MTPILYNKITPNIKKPILALIIFALGFALYSALIILPYHYGIMVPKKEGMIALSSFVLLFIIYAFFTYDNYAGFKFPYFIQKYLIDPKLRHDLEDNHPKFMQHAYILDIQPSSKSTYALLLQSAELSEPEWFHVNLNLMFPNLYFFNLIKMEQSCIGQDINIEYLPESKVILKLCASEIENDFSHLDGSPFFCAVSPNLNRIPSQFLLDFNKISNISVARTENSIDHELVCTIGNNIYRINNQTYGFKQLESALSYRIDQDKYNAFKTNQTLQITNISK